MDLRLTIKTTRSAKLKAKKSLKYLTQSLAYIKVGSSMETLFAFEIWGGETFFLGTGVCVCVWGGEYFRNFTACIHCLHLRVKFLSWPSE